MFDSEKYLIDERVFNKGIEHLFNLHTAGDGISITQEPDLLHKTIAVEGVDLIVENGLYINEDIAAVHLGADVDGVSVIINSDGKLAAGKVMPDIDSETIQVNASGLLAVAIDKDSIVYNPDEKYIEVNGVDVDAIYPAYFKSNSEGSEGTLEIGVLYDDETITLNDRHELCTVVGGGWKRSIGEMIIADGGSDKIRHHRLPNDNADYDLETINFPNVKEWGGTIDCRVTSDIAGLDSAIILEWDSDKQVWIGKCGLGDKDKPNIIVVKEDSSIVMTGNEYESAQAVGHCTVVANEVPRQKMYIDNQFLLIDSETIKVNEEGVLYAEQQNFAGVANEITSEGIINVLVDSETVHVNEDNQLYIEYATSEQLGVVRIDEDTIINKDGQIAFDMENHVDRGLDVVEGKIGHTNSVEAKTVGRDLAYLEVEYDEQGHIVDTTEKDLSIMEPCSSTVDGYKGLVPTPKKGDQTKFLTGKGTWESVASAGLFNVVVGEASSVVSPNNSFIRVVPEDHPGYKIIAPIGWTLHTKSMYTEMIEVAYPTEFGEDVIEVCVRSVAGSVDCSIGGRWLAIAE